MGQPRIDDGTRARLNAMLAGLRGYNALATRVGVASTTVGDAFRCPELTERATRQPLEPTAELVLNALGLALDMGAEVEVAEILERYCSARVQVLVDREAEPENATADDLKNLGLYANERLAELTSVIRESAEDGNIDPEELKRIRAGATGFSAYVGRLVAVAEAASGH